MWATIVALITHGVFPVILGDRVGFWKWSVLQYASPSLISMSSVIPLTVVSLMQAIALPHEIPCLLLPGIVMAVRFSKVFLEWHITFRLLLSSFTLGGYCLQSSAWLPINGTSQKRRMVKRVMISVFGISKTLLMPKRVQVLFER